MSRKPSVSIIIAAMNRLADTLECLRSIERQEYRDFEVIVVDNGSTDDTARRVAEIFPHVNIIELVANAGFAGANNIGLDASSGRLVALVNNDVVLAECWLGRMVESMSGSSQVGFCVGAIVQHDDSPVLDTAGDEFDACGVGHRRGHGQPASMYSDREDVFGACAAAVLYRRSMLERTGLFDGRFFAIGEDIDLSFRARLAGYRCLYVPEAVARHKVSQTIGVGSDFQLYHSRRNVEFVFFRCLPLPLLLLCLPFHLVYGVLTAVQAAREGRLKLFCRAKADVWKARDWLWRDRRRIQRMRRVSCLQLLRHFSWSYLPSRLRRREMVAGTSGKGTLTAAGKAK